jgi:Ulp1 family protease
MRALASHARHEGRHEYEGCTEWPIDKITGPMQLNGCDCGVFAAMFADYVVRLPASSAGVPLAPPRAPTVNPRKRLLRLECLIPLPCGAGV